MNPTAIDTEAAARLRSQLLVLARHQDDLADDEAAATPYWQPRPDTIHARRLAAEALRAEADLLLTAS
jgi:hypothetical protein